MASTTSFKVFDGDEGQWQGLTLVPILAQLELTWPHPLNLSLLCPPYSTD